MKLEVLAEEKSTVLGEAGHEKAVVNSDLKGVIY